MPSVLTETRLYKIWSDMKQRCYNPKCKKYYLYGGKNITVCDEWQKYKSFEMWAYQSGYREYLTLDRINGNGNYEPTNCKWSTYQEQANNISTNHHVEIDGISHTISEWAKIWEMPYHMARNKIYRLERKGTINRVS